MSPQEITALLTTAPSEYVPLIIMFILALYLRKNSQKDTELQKKNFEKLSSVVEEIQEMKKQYGDLNNRVEKIEKGHSEEISELEKDIDAKLEGFNNTLDLKLNSTTEKLKAMINALEAIFEQNNKIASEERREFLEKLAEYVRQLDRSDITQEQFQKEIKRINKELSNMQDTVVKLQISFAKFSGESE